MSPDQREHQAETHHSEQVVVQEQPSRFQRVRDGAREKLMYGPMARLQTQRQINRERRNYRPQFASEEYLVRHDKRVERRQKIDRVAAAAIIGGVALIALIKAAKGYDITNFHNPPAIDLLPYIDGDGVDTWPGEGTPDLLHFHNPPGVDILPLTDGPGDWLNDDYITDWWPGGADRIDPDAPDVDPPDVDVSPDPNLPDVDKPDVDAPPMPDVDTPDVDEGNLSEKEAEMEIIRQNFKVEPGHGVTHEIIDQGHALGIDVSPEESYEIYQKLEARFGDDMIQGPGTYQYNGEVRISAPGQARWNAEAIELMQRQLKKLEEDDD